MCPPKKGTDSGGKNYSPRKYAANLQTDMPLGTKMRYIAKNMWLRVAKLQPCCGHPGEPGC